MTVPFLLNKGEEVLKDSTIDFFVGESHSTRVGQIFLTNERLVIVESHITKDQIFAVVPLNSLVSVEPYEYGALFFKRTGFRICFTDQMGEIIEVRVYPLNRLKRDVAIKWASEWKDEVQKAFQKT